MSPGDITDIWRTESDKSVSASVLGLKQIWKYVQYVAKPSQFLLHYLSHTCGHTGEEDF